TTSSAMEQQNGVHVSLAKRLYLAGDALADEVVTQEDDELVVADELATDADAVRDTPRLVLLDVSDARTKPATVPHRSRDLLAGHLQIGRHDDGYVGHTRFDQVLQGVEEDRLIRHRHQLLRARKGQRPQPRALAAREHDPLHVRFTDLPERAAS